MSEVYDRYVDTAGNYHYADVETGHHVIPNTAVGNFPPPQTIQTNADRIRSMTDKELAEWFCTMCNFGDFCPYKDDCDTNGSGVLKWLKEEVN